MGFLTARLIWRGGTVEASSVPLVGCVRFDMTVTRLCDNHTARAVIRCCQGVPRPLPRKIAGRFAPDSYLSTKDCNHINKALRVERLGSQAVGHSHVCINAPILPRQSQCPTYQHPIPLNVNGKAGGFPSEEYLTRADTYIRKDSPRILWVPVQAQCCVMATSPTSVHMDVGS